MSTIHKCDKCDKKLSGLKLEISLYDSEKMLIKTPRHFNKYELCEKCAGPLAKYLIKYLKLTKKDN